ncbi:hypothetical protein HYY75_07420, partial [bacterium]|nr:hypothetical protein [bacterium]
MVSSVRNGMWVGGLASGLDTQGLIDKFMAIERVPLTRIQAKRDTLNFQKTLLQDVNLKVFELQSRATDLTFSKTFNTKKVDSSDSKIVSGVATTAAEVGTYNINIKQIATSTKAYS